MYKEQNIRKAFLEYMLENNIQKDELNNLIKSFSYFIGCKNEEYRYNLTYLESFCDKFMLVKHNIKKKNKYFITFLEYVVSLKNDEIEIFNITMDDFWNFEYEVNSAKINDYNSKITHTGIINEKQLENDTIKLDFSSRVNNVNYIDYCIIELKCKDRRKINREIKKFVKRVLERCKKIGEDN